jgi:hypothetical protein
MSKYNEDKRTKKAVDKRLEKIAGLECGMGSDTTKKEREEVKRLQRPYWMEIKELDLEFFNLTYKLDK